MQPDYSWMIPVEVMLGSLDHGEVQACSISRVPDVLRDAAKDDAYMPKLVSIGPLHRGATRHFLLMEEPKWRYMKDFLDRQGPQGETENSKSEVRLRNCGHDILKLDKVSRACYGGDVALEPHELTKIMIVDGCFLLELLLRLGDYIDSSQQSQRERYSNDPLLETEEKVMSVLNDISMLENQIPFLVLKKLYRKVFPDGSGIEDDHRVANVMRKALGYPLQNNSGAAHILHMMHLSTVEQGQQEGTGVRRACQELDRCATRLLAAGITIKPANANSFGTIEPANSTNLGSGDSTVEPINSSNLGNGTNTTEPTNSNSPGNSTTEPADSSNLGNGNGNVAVESANSNNPGNGTGTTIEPANGSNHGNGNGNATSQHKFVDRFNFNISFWDNDKVLEIPPLHIKETTEVRWRNLIAWEQSRIWIRCKYTSYALFFQGLICCKHDIEFLEEIGVIVNESKKSKEELLNMFRTIPKGAEHMDSGYSQICVDLNAHRANIVTKAFHECPIITWHQCRFVLESMVYYGRNWYNILIREHIPTVWKFIAVLAAASLLVLTMMQTYYSSRSVG